MTNPSAKACDLLIEKVQGFADIRYPYVWLSDLFRAGGNS